MIASKRARLFYAGFILTLALSNAVTRVLVEAGGAYKYGLRRAGLP
jgi:hypothetical protein